MMSPVKLVAILLAGLCSFTVGVRRHEDSPDGHLLAADTVERVKEALAEGANINVQDEVNGQTAVMRATLHGWTSIVAYLLDQGADVSIGEKDGYTPPHGAGFQGRAKIMSILRDHNVDVVSPAEKDGFTPFHRACWGRETRHTETIRYLLEDLGVDANLKGGPDQQTCFQMTPNAKTRALLVQHGAGNAEL
ncbi:and SAM domain-containing protein 6 [Seminavis robusta]|uniref:And SAM domain-containing protein 6 n=1 Tax=Seminavis robusta TaxID=568900 RepID=A0A9N8HFS7_9STRA|nr:and SAM domain-containing protein 6 [Seminavis robusta]|eukprot:Sro589_g171810.1 and SAM domain-containing protein 6 (192) ;mRNA; r:46321-46896